MVVVEATVAIGVLTSVLANLPNEVSKHYISKILNRDEHLKKLREALDGKLEKLKKTLESMDANPAGHSYLNSDWLDNLEQLRYDLEDIQDSEDRDFATKSLEANIEQVNKMQKVLEDGEGYRVSFGENSETSLYDLPADDSLRNEEKRKIIEELTMESDSLGVSLIGICGLGKTVMAKAVADAASIKAHFPCIITPPKYAPNFNLGSILEHIKGKLISHENQRVLILLDDIHAVHPNDWFHYGSLLHQSIPGSKVLITTQNPQVADVTRTSKHSLKPLSDDECFKLIQKLANSNGELPTDDESALIHNRKELAGKCRGLPLLANYVGLLLSAAQHGGRGKIIQELTSPSEAPAGLEWVLINLNPVSVLVQKPLLKRCLAYCSLFPQDYEFKEDSLVQFWMAEGFTPLSRTETDARSLRKATGQNFQDLRSYTLFQTSKSPMGEEPSYQMHEVAYDLAQHVSSKICCQMHIGTSFSTPSSSNMSKVRHFSLSCDYVGDGKNNVVENLLGLIKDECLIEEGRWILEENFLFR